MKLSEIEEYLLVSAGQHLVGASLQDLEFSHAQVWLLVQRSLKEYEKYVPVEVTTTIGSVNDHTFTTRIPLYVTGVIPTLLPHFSGQAPVASAPYNIAFEYVKPTLFFSLAIIGNITIDAAYRYTYKLLDEVGNYTTDTGLKYDSAGVTTTTVGTMVDVDIPEIDFSSTSFLDLVEGRFLISLARSRRAFTIADMPITTDADVLVTEGQTLLDETLNDLGETNSSWFLAVRP